MKIWNHLEDHKREPLLDGLQKLVNLSRRSIYFLVTIIFATATYITHDLSVWGINDDFVIEQILNSQDASIGNKIVSFMSLLLGFILGLLYDLGGNWRWYGLFISLSNLIFILTSVKILITFTNGISKKIFILVLLILSPYLILNPTYTVTSILVSSVGILLFLNLVRVNNSGYLEYLFAGLITSLGFFIRTDSLKGSFVFFGFFVMVYLYLNYNHIINIKRALLFVAPIVVSVCLELLLMTFVIQKSSENREYLSWQKTRHQLFYTPAILKLHQNVAAGEVLKGTWGDVEFTLLRNWAYGDQKVYSSTNIEIGRDFVKNYAGIRGLFNSEFDLVSEDLIGYLKNVYLIMILCSLAILIAIILAKRKKILGTLILALLVGYLVSFYYAAAVLRLPIRVTLPYLLIFILIIIFCLEFSEAKSKSKTIKLGKFVNVLLIGFFFWFSIFKPLGFLGIINDNKSKLSWAKQRNVEINNFSKDATYIGPLMHVPSAVDGPYLSKLNYTSLSQTLVLNWSTFSRTWNFKAEQLGVNPNNIYKSLAKGKEIYLVSEPYIASVVEMYMNDHQITRGKMCPLADLSGYDNAKIFTYQAKEEVC